jgi:hypothetical protein
MAMPMIKHQLGERFERLTIIEDAGPSKHGARQWRCRCDCGSILVVTGSKLRGSITRSCGCLGIDLRTKHGLADSRLHYAWRNMRQRTRNPKRLDYRHYGERGIGVCDQWNDFPTFHAWAIDNGYGDNLTLDRIDNNKGYEPGNCRWVTQAVQVLNRRCSKLTMADAAAIRNDPRSGPEIAAAYGISASHAWRVKTGKALVDACRGRDLVEARRG